jgi:hypothetical protein
VNEVLVIFDQHVAAKISHHAAIAPIILGKRLAGPGRSGHAFSGTRTKQ